MCIPCAKLLQADKLNSEVLCSCRADVPFQKKRPAVEIPEISDSERAQLQDQIRKVQNTEIGPGRGGGVGVCEALGSCSVLNVKRSHWILRTKCPNDRETG